MVDFTVTWLSKAIFICCCRTWLQWILNVEHGRPVSIHHVLLNLIFGNIAASIFYPNSCFQVVKVATVELKEFNEQNTNVDVRTAHVFPVVKLENHMIQVGGVSEISTVLFAVLLRCTSCCLVWTLIVPIHGFK